MVDTQQQKLRHLHTLLNIRIGIALLDIKTQAIGVWPKCHSRFDNRLYGHVSTNPTSSLYSRIDSSMIVFSGIPSLRFAAFHWLSCAEITGMDRFCT